MFAEESLRSSEETEPQIIALRFSRRKFLALLDQQSTAAYKLIYGMAQQLAERQRGLNAQVRMLEREKTELQDYADELQVCLDEYRDQD